MKQERAFPRVNITKKGEWPIKAGHPWVYDAEVLGSTDAVENGSLVDAFSDKGSYLGTGFLSKNSKIRLRLLSNNANEKFDEPFFRAGFVTRWITARPSWAKTTAAAA